MLEKVIEKIEKLSVNEIHEVENFVDYLKFKSEIRNANNILKMFEAKGINNWYSLSQAIRSSGIDVGPVGGYMDRASVRVWMKYTYGIPEDKAEESLELLVKMSLLHESTMTPNIK